MSSSGADFDSLAHAFLFSLVSGMMVHKGVQEGGNGSLMLGWRLVALLCVCFTQHTHTHTHSLSLSDFDAHARQVSISLRELMPTARSYDPGNTYVTLCTVVGMVVMAASLMLFAA